MRLLDKLTINQAVAAEIDGPTIDVEHIGLLSVQAKNSATITTGVVKLQGSNADAPASGDWTDIPNATVNVTAAAAYGFSVADLAWKKVRAVYTQANGSGTIAVRVFGKGF